MSNFITKPDYYTGKRMSVIDQITDEDDTLLDKAEAWAIATVRDHLFQHYDTDTIFAQTDDDRNERVMQWCIDLALYRIYERTDDSFVPESIIKNYDDTMEDLKEILSGDKPVDLPRLQDEDEEYITKFQHGGAEQRSTF